MLQYLKGQLPSFKESLSFMKNTSVKNFIKFFVLMIILTLLSNIASSLTIAQVSDVTPITSFIYNRIETSGKVQANKEFYLKLPVGLTIDEIFVSNGQTVKRGDLLLQANLSLLEKAIEKQKVEISRKKVDMQLATLEDSDDLAYSMKNAQDDLQNSAADYEYTLDHTNRAIDVARADLLESSREYRIARKEYFQINSDNEDDSVAAVKNYEKTHNEYSKAREAFVQIDVKYRKALTEHESEVIIDELKKDYESKKINFAKISETYNRACRTFDSALTLSENTDDPAGLEKLKSAKKDLVSQQRNLDNVLSECKRQLELSERTVETCKNQLDKLKQTKESATKKAGITQNLNALIFQQFLLSNEADEELLILLEQIRKNNGEIYADSDGQIINISVANNAVTSEHAFVFTSTEGGYSFAFSVLPDDSVGLDLGKTGKLKIDDKTFDVAISSIASAQNEDGYIAVVARITSFDTTGIYHGRDGDINIEKSKNKYDLCLPISAVKHDQTGDFVYSLEEHQNVLGIETILVKNSVKIVETDDEMVAVNGALDQKSSILLHSYKIVGEGDRVRLVS